MTVNHNVGYVDSGELIGVVGSINAVTFQWLHWFQSELENDSGPFCTMHGQSGYVYEVRSFGSSFRIAYHIVFILFASIGCSLNTILLKAWNLSVMYVLILLLFSADILTDQNITHATVPIHMIVCMFTFLLHKPIISLNISLFS